MTNTLTPGMTKFIMAVSAVSTKLGKCSAAYRNMGVTVAAWDAGKTTVQLVDDGDDVYVHYEMGAPVSSNPTGLSQAQAAEVLHYASSQGIVVGSPAPPKP